MKVNEKINMLAEMMTLFIATPFLLVKGLPFTRGEIMGKAPKVKKYRWGKGREKERYSNLVWKAGLRPIYRPFSSFGPYPLSDLCGHGLTP